MMPVYTTGSTPARTRLYRIGITRHFAVAIKHFDIYGLLDNEWIEFDKGIEFDEFLIKRKHL